MPTDSKHILHDSPEEGASSPELENRLALLPRSPFTFPFLISDMLSDGGELKTFRLGKMSGQPDIQCFSTEDTLNMFMQQDNL